jgi:hypothetical protein
MVSLAVSGSEGIAAGEVNSAVLETGRIPAVPVPPAKPHTLCPLPKHTGVACTALVLPGDSKTPGSHSTDPDRVDVHSLCAASPGVDSIFKFPRRMCKVTETSH